jgi:hypothetical protein
LIIPYHIYCILRGVVLGYGDVCSTEHAASASELELELRPNALDGIDGAGSLPPAFRPFPEGLAVAPSRILQGLEVVWSDENSDVLLLRLNNEISEEFAPYKLGWDASGRPRRRRASATIHHSAGDAKKLSLSEEPLAMIPWREPEPSHWVVRWTDGATQSGSSGATLFDVTSGLGLGVLTGGPPPRDCRTGVDLFGSFYYAWNAGLWRHLSPDASHDVIKQGASYESNGPGIIVTPARVIVRERPDSVAALRVRLSDPPLPEETVAVNVSVVLPPGSTLFNATSIASANNIVVQTPEIVFDSENWNLTQDVFLLPGQSADPAASHDPEAFKIVLQLRSDTRPELHKRSVVPALRIGDAPPGLSPEFPIMLAGGQMGLQAFEAGEIAADAASMGPVELGSPLHTPEVAGTVVFYNVTVSNSVRLDVGACSPDSPLQVVIYRESEATWSSTEPCATTDALDCENMDDVQVRGASIVLRAILVLLKRVCFATLRTKARTLMHMYVGSSNIRILSMLFIQGCSGLLNIVLDGPASSVAEPFTIAIRTKDGSPARYVLSIRQTTAHGLLFAADDSRAIQDITGSP